MLEELFPVVGGKDDEGPIQDAGLAELVEKNPDATIEGPYRPSIFGSPLPQPKSLLNRRPGRVG
jgi:hypothetical protein